MFEVKVLTGRIKNRKITLARSKMAKRLIKDGWKLLSVNADMHPAEIVEYVDKLIDLVKKESVKKAFFLSNCDHVFNRLRVLRTTGQIDDVEFIHFCAKNSACSDSSEEIAENHISVTPDGECSCYPQGFLDEWNNQLLQIWASSEENKTDKGDSHD